MIFSAQPAAAQEQSPTPAPHTYVTLTLTEIMPAAQWREYVVLHSKNVKLRFGKLRNV
jgi:hypothetical protein